MPIQPLSLLTPLKKRVQNIFKNTTPYEAQQQFGAMLKDAISNVNAQQKVSDTMTDKLIRGEQVELHDVMIASQKASIMLSGTMEVRNKVIEAYQEIMRMSV
ncbi:MAG: flagellar hook-basal body complex protein FliE [Planococcaceae bacterium]|nr:flagellar hook-basal body complex protein FliE [Planococcaceae bacterium]